MSLVLWTLLPLLALHGWFFLRHRKVFYFQLLLDVILAAVVGPALWIGGDLNPVRCLERLPPFTAVEWSEHTDLQPTQSDVVLQFHPWWEETGRRLHHGRLALIQPGVGAGLPLMANGQTGLWAPMMLPVWLHGVERGTTIMALWKLELAGIGAFLLLTGRRLQWTAAAVGGVAWGGAPYLVGWLLVPLAWVAALLPWAWMMAFWCLERTFWRVTVVGAFFGWMMGSGLHPETSAVVCGSALLMALIQQPRKWTRAVAVGVISGVVAVMVSWPTVGLIRASSRHALVAESGANLEGPPWSIQRDLARQIVVPSLMGHPGRADWQPQYPHAPGAAGVGGVVLGLLAVGVIAGRHRRLAWSAGVVAALGLIIFVRVPPLDALLVRIPPLDQMTLPRFGVLIPWGLILLAALALDGALEGRIRSGAVRFLPAGVMVVVVMTTLPWQLSQGSAWLVVLSSSLAVASACLRWRSWIPVLAAVELALLAVGINPVADRADRLPVPALVERLQALNEEHPARIIGLAAAFPPNLATRYGLRDLRASDPLRPKQFARLMGVFGEPKTILGGPLMNAPAGLSGAWGVGYAVTRPKMKLQGWQEVYSGPDGRIWSNPRLLPEVRVVGSVTIEPESQQRLMTMVDGVDFESTALVPPGSAAISATTTIIELGLRTPSRLKAVVECNGTCLVVVAQPWAPGWRATVDSKPGEMILTNVAGLGVAVPQGRHRVEFSYHPWAW